MLDSIPGLLNSTFPVPGRFRSALPSGIKELSELLTNRRGSRSLSYLTRPNLLSAYLHYFLPWNLYRLCLLLPELNFSLSPGSTITDLGCGPLTLASALWISQPDLRKIPLEFNCIDRSGPALEAGKKFFSALCKSTNTDMQNNIWKINLIKEDIDFRKPKTVNITMKASLVCAINIFNEVYENLSHNNTEGLKRMAANAAHFMHNIALPDASILTVEPGVPQSGRFIAFLRDEFIRLKRLALAPCTHSLDCPLGNKKWCHFAFETFDAPKELQRLSAAAKLPKERLVFSFILAGASITPKTALNPENESKSCAIRVISDAFALPGGRFGRYGCSAQGLILLTGDKNHIDKLSALDIVLNSVFNGHHDAKSGAQIREVK
ncbi:MAG: small ribosomal subunit Rsm22 family protein [Treponema sp.]|nr:small ribosomal subunit Rsm22 family protein [Treponema sp.]